MPFMSKENETANPGPVEKFQIQEGDSSSPSNDDVISKQLDSTAQLASHTLMAKCLSEL